MKNFFRTGFKKENLKMFYSNVNSHVFRINFANKAYFSNIIKLLTCSHLMNKSQYKFFALSNSENGIEDLLVGDSNNLVINGKDIHHLPLDLNINSNLSLRECNKI
jgi:hypothetical protein